MRSPAGAISAKRRAARGASPAGRSGSSIPTTAPATTSPAGGEARCPSVSSPTAGRSSASSSRSRIRTTTATCSPGRRAAGRYGATGAPPRRICPRRWRPRTWCSSPARATATRRRTCGAWLPRATAPSPASPTAWPWWGRARRRPPPPSSPRARGTTPRATRCCGARAACSWTRRPAMSCTPTTAPAKRCAPSRGRRRSCARSRPGRGRRCQRVRGGASVPHRSPRDGRSRTRGCSRVRRAVCSGRSRATTWGRSWSSAGRPRSPPAIPMGRACWRTGADGGSWPASPPTIRRWPSPSRARSSGPGTTTTPGCSTPIARGTAPSRSTSATRPAPRSSAT